MEWEKGGAGGGKVEADKASFAKFRTCGLNYSLKRRRVLGGVGGGGWHGPGYIEALEKLENG